MSGAGGLSLLARVQAALDPAGPGQPAAGAGSGAGLDVEAVAGLTLQLGRVADQMEASALRQFDLANSIRTIPNIVAPQGITANSAVTIDAADLLGPRTGQCWDVKRLSVETFSAGTVTAYLNGEADQNIVAAFTQAGNLYFGKAQLTLEGGQRLIFVGSGLTGNVTVSLGVIEVAAIWWADYLI